MTNDNDDKVDRTDTLLARIRNTVREYYVESGMTQKALARKTGIGAVPLNGIIKGRRSIYADELVMLALELGIPMNEFFGPELWSKYERRVRRK